MTSPKAAAAIIPRSAPKSHWRLGPALGLTDEETETVSWLVLHHLLMSATAFKRDIDDPKTILDLADTIQSPERLRLLLILTVADMDKGSEVCNAASVGRFQVMALLQAARAYTLDLPLESAYSWGLNRAIFYAAAKRGFKGKRRAPRATREGAVPSYGRPKSQGKEYYLGDELAFEYEGSDRRNPIFVIGGELQTEADFKRQIEARFSGSFAGAWKEALEYVSSFNKETLLSGSGFFSSVYRPKRDEFAEKWSEIGGASSGGRKEEKKHVKATEITRNNTTP